MAAVHNVLHILKPEAGWAQVMEFSSRTYENDVVEYVNLWKSKRIKKIVIKRIFKN
jgi:hypothetical protein